MSELATRIRPTAAAALADEIVELTRRDGDTTHGRLITHFGDLVRGDCNLRFESSNLVVLVGASELLCEAMLLVRDEIPRRVEFGECHSLVAMIDGCPIPRRMPWAKRPPAGGYKHEHFHPMRLVPIAETNQGD